MSVRIGKSRLGIKGARALTVVLAAGLLTFFAPGAASDLVGSISHNPGPMSNVCRDALSVT